MQKIDIVMLMYKLLKYSKNYSSTSGSLRNYYRDKLTDKTNDDNGPKKNAIITPSLLNIRQVLQEVLIMFPGE